MEPGIVLGRYREEDVYSFYLGEQISVHKKYKSPFREERFASLTFMYKDNGQLLWTDWGDAGQLHPYNLFEFVKKLYSCSFEEAKEHILEDIGANEAFCIDAHRKSLESPKNSFKSKIVNFDIRTREFNQFDIDYWAQFGITVNTLNLYNVFAVNEFYVNGNLVKGYVENEPMYAYVFIEDGQTYYKIYDPLNPSRDRKWRYNGKQHLLQGYDQLPLTNDYIIITKSMKDVMCLFEMGVVSVALQSESTRYDSDLHYKLSKRFDKFIVFFDNDETGKNFAKNISNIYYIPSISIPDEYYINDGIKDISDYVKKYGTNAGLDMMFLLLNNII